MMRLLLDVRALAHLTTISVLLIAAPMLGADRKPSDVQNPGLRILVPVYFYPNGDGRKSWERMIAAADRGNIAAIVNPASGPGKTTDPNYEDILKSAKKSKLHLIGYVSTSYAKRPLPEVKADVELWLKLYPGLHGFFLDEQSSSAEHTAHYAEIGAFIRAKQPKALIIANPGVVCDVAYFEKKTADVWCVFETKNRSTDYVPPTWASRYPADRFAVLSYAMATPSLESAIQDALKKRVGYLYLTDDNLPNPWDTLPPYFEEQVRKAAEVNRTGG